MNSCRWNTNKEPEIVEETHTLESFAEKLFSEPAKKPQSIPFKIDNENSDKIEHIDLFKMLLTIFHIGMKNKFSDENGKVDMTKLSTSDIFKIQEYFRSIGFDLHIETQTQEDRDIFGNEVNLDIPESKKDTFEAHYFRLNDNRTGNSYFIRFSEYKRY